LPRDALNYRILLILVAVRTVRFTTFRHDQSHMTHFWPPAVPVYIKCF